MGQVIDICSRLDLEENQWGESDSNGCQFIEYDPPIQAVVSF